MRPTGPHQFRRILDGEKASKKEVDTFLWEYKSMHGCLLCSEKNPVCLEFHHRNRADKEFTLAQARQSHIAIHRIVAEIKKCDLLCRNCHAKKEFNLLGTPT